MPVLITSFKMSTQYKYTFKVFSVARFQPQGFSYPKLSFLAAKGPDGKKLLLRDFVNPLEGYKRALYAGFTARKRQVQKWLDGLDPDENIALACWCPYSAATQRQLRRFGTFACHTGLIARMINKHRPDVNVILDTDHARLVPQWMPKQFTVIDVADEDVGGGRFATVWR